MHKIMQSITSLSNYVKWLKGPAVWKQMTIKIRLFIWGISDVLRFGMNFATWTGMRTEMNVEREFANY